MISRLLLHGKGNLLLNSSFWIVQFRSHIPNFIFFNRFISEVEAVCRQWMSDGPKNLLVCLLGLENLNVYVV